MITNDAGEVALIYFQPIDKFVSMGDTKYIFRTRFNISLCYVKPEHVQPLLSTTQTCCGGQRNSGIFREANDMHVRIWSGISER